MRRVLLLLAMVGAALSVGAAPAAGCPDARWCMTAEQVPGSADLLNPVLAVGGSAKDPHLYVAGDAPQGAAGAPKVLARTRDRWSVVEGGATAPSRLLGSRGAVAASGEDLWWATSSQGTAALTRWSAHGEEHESDDHLVESTAAPRCAGAGVARVRIAAAPQAVVLAGTTEASATWATNGLFSGGSLVVGVRRVGVRGEDSTSWRCLDDRVPAAGPPAVDERDGVLAVPFLLATDEHPGYLALAVDSIGDHVAAPLGSVVPGPPERVVLGETAGSLLACGASDGNLGWAGFDAAGHRFAGAVGASPGPPGEVILPGTSPEFHVWVDDRKDPVKITAPRAISSAWLVASPSAEGAFVVLGTPGPDGDCAARDLHVAQIDVDSDEVPVVGPVVPVARGVNAPCGSVAGAAIGPDGRLHLAVQAGSGDCARPAGPGSPREVRLLSAPAPQSGRACRSATKRPSGRPRSDRAQGAGLCRDGGRSRHAR